MIDWFVSAWNDLWRHLWQLRLVFVCVAPPLVFLSVLLMLFSRKDTWR